MNDEYTIDVIRKVNTGEIEISYTIEKQCISKDFSKPPTTRFYNGYLLIPKDKIADLQKAINDNRW